MRKILLALSLFGLLASPAHGAAVSTFTDATALGGTELFYVVQGAADRKATPAQINTYVRSLMGTGISTWLNTPTSANLAASVTDETGTGALVFATSPVLVTPNLGTPSAVTLTNGTGLPIAGTTGWGTGVAAALAAALNSGTGLIGALTPTNSNCVVGNGTAWTSAACPGGGGTGANPTATAGPTAVNGVATTFMRSDGAPAIQQGSSSQKGIVQVDGTTITESSGVISAAPTSAVPSTQTGTNYAIVNGDRAKVIYLSNAAAQTPTLPSAATLTSSNGWYVTVCNIAAGIQTITPTTSTIGGAASLALPGGSAASPRCVNIVSDGTNYLIVPSANSYTIASGTAALGTSAISSAACATVVTASAPGVATTDVVLASFNGDPTAVTGYVPATAGMLTIIGYPTANNVNFKVCNNTSSSVTPGAITLNWRVTR